MPGNFVVDESCVKVLFEVAWLDVTGDVMWDYFYKGGDGVTAMLVVRENGIFVINSINRV